MDRGDEEEGGGEEVAERLRRALSVSAEDGGDGDEGAAAAAAAATGGEAAAGDGAEASSSAGAVALGELYLQEIEAVDDYWGPTFRAVYESDSQRAFLGLLEERIAAHDQEIEKMCNHHYQGFISSVRDLLCVRADAASLNREVREIDQEMRDSADKVAVKGKELVRARRVERNIAATIESLSLCLPVLQMFTKLKKQMAERRYHPALKTLEQLEHTFLPRIAGYRFSRQMTESIPRLREAIKEASMVELKDFLETLRKFSPKIGEMAMRNTAARLRLESDYLAGTAASPSASMLHQTEQEPKRAAAVAPQPNPFTGDEPDYEGQSESTYEAEEDLSAQDLVDFGPVYKCLHIHAVLGERDAFEKYYRKQRRQQATLTLQPPSAMMHESLDAYRAYFHGIVGFFACEHHVLGTGGGLVTREYLADLWQATSARIMATLRTHSAHATDSHFMLRVKRVMLLFAASMTRFGLADDKVFALLQELRDHYTEVLMQKWVARFTEIFEVDNYHPMQVDTLVEYEEVVSSLPLASNLGLESSPFPRQFPFSAMVPKVCAEVRAFILACVRFSRDLNLTPDQVDEATRKATNALLTRTLSGCLSGLIRREKNSLGLLQLIQIDVNTRHLEETNAHLERFIAEATGAAADAPHVARLQGRSSFQDIRVEAEEEIHAKLLSKVDEFVGLADYDWLMLEPLGTCSPWLSDLLAFLSSVFHSFAELPARSCMAALQHLSRAMQTLLLDASDAVSMGLVQQMDLDLVQCEQFAAGEPVKGLEEGVLLLCFADLRQLLDLFVSWDWSTYLADYGSPSAANKYLRVKPESCLKLLERLREADRRAAGGNVLTAIISKKDRDKKRLVETVHKQLRALVTAQASAGGGGTGQGAANAAVVNNNHGAS